MSVVLDASALLAYLQDEPGGERVKAVLGSAVLSTVNWAEVIGKAREREIDTEGLQEDLEALGLADSRDSRFLQFSIVTIPDDNRQGMTANLQGPLIINTENREARQCISRDDRWGVRHNILEEMAAGKNAC